MPTGLNRCHFCLCFCVSVDTTLFHTTQVVQSVNSYLSKNAYKCKWITQNFITMHLVQFKMLADSKYVVCLLSIKGNFISINWKQIRCLLYNKVRYYITNLSLIYCEHRSTLVPSPVFCIGHTFYLSLLTNGQCAICTISFSLFLNCLSFFYFPCDCWFQRHTHYLCATQTPPKNLSVWN